jgi:hypothetical protein
MTPDADPAVDPSAPDPRPGRATALVVAIAVAAIVLIASAGSTYAAWTFTDLDQDGLDVRTEHDLHTDPAIDDSDRDGIGDGWESRRDLDPLRKDSDGDGFDDRIELDARSDPLSTDSDGDQLPDQEEGLGADCDHDGIPALREDDDDADLRRDVTEPAGQRCDPDVDDDGVLDGAERNRSCIVVADCDADGLDDHYERNTTFDPLNPDTFGVGLEDAILDAFQRRGQPPSGDEDDDGIPDAWEDNAGLIDWGAFVPTRGNRDLLVEFVRVIGPDSGRHAGLSFEPAYNMVRDLFITEGGIRFQYVETRINIPAEQVPALIPSSESAYYQDILNRSVYSTNPYVTTVVLNPQHDQSELLHAGIAPIRGMLAAIDYGVPITFRYTLGNANLYLRPLLESAIQSNRLDLVRAFGWTTGGILANGEMFVDGGTYNIVWRPYWFRTTPRIVTDEGETIPLAFHSASVDQADLARTIAHELGHTLGLCHLDIAGCLAGIAEAEHAQRTTSTMYPSSSSLHFLASEWNNARRYMTCPAHGPVSLLANNATDAAILDEKYGYALSEILDVGLRECGDFTVLRDDLVPYATSIRYDPPMANLDPPPTKVRATWSLAYLALAALHALTASSVAAVLVARRLRPGSQTFSAPLP